MGRETVAASLVCEARGIPDLSGDDWVIKPPAGPNEKRKAHIGSTKQTVPKAVKNWDIFGAGYAPDPKLERPKPPAPKRPKQPPGASVAPTSHQFRAYFASTDATAGARAGVKPDTAKAARPPALVDRPASVEVEDEEMFWLQWWKTCTTVAAQERGRRRQSTEHTPGQIGIPESPRGKSSPLLISPNAARPVWAE
jgi:hypothetical protein